MPSATSFARIWRRISGLGSFDVKQTRWMEGEQIDEVELKKLTRTFDAVGVIAEKGNRETPSVIWIERAPE